MTEISRDGHHLSDRTAPASIANRLRHLILSRALSPGERLVQSELADQLGVSRTPIREALHRLESEGLVKLSPHKGASVADLSISELEDIYGIRIALEGYGAFLASRNVTDAGLEQLEALVLRMRKEYERGNRWRLLEVNRDFYAVLYAIANRPRLYELIMKHLDLAELYRRMAFAMDSYFRNTIADHEELLGALRRHDPEEAEWLTQSQLRQTLTSLLAFLEETHKPGAEGS